MGLSVLGALLGLCGFCTREWLGGFGACCVFAPIYSFICLYFIRFSSSSPIFWGFAFVVLCLFSCLVLFVFVSLWVFVVSFSLSDYTQKERARRVGASSLVLL